MIVFVRFYQGKKFLVCTASTELFLIISFAFSKKIIFFLCTLFERKYKSGLARVNLPKRSTTGRLATKKARRHERWCCYDRCCLTRAQQQLQWESNRVSKANRSWRTEKTTNKQNMLREKSSKEGGAENRNSQLLYLILSQEARCLFIFNKDAPHHSQCKGCGAKGAFNCSIAKHILTKRSSTGLRWYKLDAG